MTRLLTALFACALFIIPAHAAPKLTGHCVADNNGRVVCGQASQRMGGLPRGKRYSSTDPRPGKWCAWWLRRELGIARSAFRPYEYNLARAFRYIGSPASGPAVGAIVVWRSHVGIITGRTESGWQVKSGNDGGRVRERVRSLKGAIAFRWPHQQWASR